MIKKCTGCGKKVNINVTLEQEFELNDSNGRKVQDILPLHTPEEREIFISGLCEECWNNLGCEFNDDLNNVFRSDLDDFKSDFDELEDMFCDVDIDDIEEDL